MVQMNKDERVWVCFEFAKSADCTCSTKTVAQSLGSYHPCDTQELQKIQAAWH